MPTLKKVKYINSNGELIKEESLPSNVASTTTINIDADQIKHRKNTSAYSRWTQLNLKHTPDFVKLNQKHHSALSLFLTMINKMDNRNELIASMKVLGQLVGMSRQSVATNIKILRHYNFINVHKSGNTNIYGVNDELTWKTYSNRMRYASFDAKVIIGKDEQPEARHSKSEK